MGSRDARRAKSQDKEEEMNYRKRISLLERRLRTTQEWLKRSKENEAREAVAARRADMAIRINDQLSDICNNQLAELRALREECAKLRLGERQ